MSKKIAFLFLSILFFLQNVGAQNSMSTDKAFDASVINTLKQDGKIYIVIAVLVIILLGLFFYLWRLEKKITQLEKQK